MKAIVTLNCNRCLNYDRKYAEDCHPIFCNMVPKTETYSFSKLNESDKQYLRKLAHFYFYEWHEQVWGEAASKRLPIVAKASNMLIIGEDLGLLAPVVPQKMHEHGLLGLRVQRMPANPKDDFWRCEDYEWMTVCTPATHDCPGIRSWWLNEEVAVKYMR